MYANKEVIIKRMKRNNETYIISVIMPAVDLKNIPII
jgi:hypothetical protein